MEPSLFLSEMDPKNLEVLGRTPRLFLRRNAGSAGSPGSSGANGTSGAGSANGSSATTGTANMNDPLAERWKCGRKLFHDDYGYGMITKSFYREDELLIMVSFETGGEKRFMPRYQAKSLLLVED
jgi:DNA helicase-2/ATP-dependent DNA helicase PcrA